MRHEIGDQARKAQAAGNLTEVSGLRQNNEAIDLFRPGAELNREVGTGTEKAWTWATWARRCSTSTGPTRPSSPGTGPAHVRRDRLSGRGRLRPAGSSAAVDRSLGRDREALDSLPEALTSHRAAETGTGRPSRCARSARAQTENGQTGAGPPFLGRGAGDLRRTWGRDPGGTGARRFGQQLTRPFPAIRGLPPIGRQGGPGTMLRVSPPGGHLTRGPSWGMPP